ncbi:MAG: hypothetical protein R3B70_12000 [Polyangiaceae bacterium]
MPAKLRPATARSSSGQLLRVGNEAAMELEREQRHILRPFAQRGQRHLDDGEAVIQVLAERALVDAPRERAVRGGDDAHVDRASDAGADPPHAARLDRAEQLRLKGERHLADLVEEERPAVRLFEHAFSIRGGAAERAPHVPEQLAR